MLLFGYILTRMLLGFFCWISLSSLFQGSGYWQWDEIKQTDFSSYPKPVSQLFYGLPSSTDAALTWTNGYIYFFKGTQYWRINQYHQAVEKAYPLSTATHWMHCDDWTTRGHQGFNASLILHNDSWLQCEMVIYLDPDENRCSQTVWISCVRNFLH